MTDREMLELAAKAAGIEIDWRTWVTDPKAVMGCCFALVGTYTYWNPLTDDGDALRLAVQLGLFDLDELLWDYANDPLIDTSKDIYAAIRRAITRAAAEIGKAMKEAALRRD